MQERDYEYYKTCFYLPDKQAIATGIWPLVSGYNIGKENYKFGPTSRDVHVIQFVRSGIVHFRGDHFNYVLKSGDLFCIFPGQTTFYCTGDPHQTVRLLWLTLDGPIVNSLLASINITQGCPVLHRVMTKEAQQMHHDLYRMIEQRTPGLQLAGKIMEWLQLIYAASTADSTLTQQDWIETGKQCLTLHYNEGASVADAARYINMDRSYFAKQFAGKFGVAPMQYIQQLKIAKSKELLELTALSVTDIAHAIGYKDIYAFSKFFKNHTGASPQQYRMQTGEQL